MDKMTSFWSNPAKPQRAGLFVGVSVVTVIAIILMTAFIVQASYIGKIMPRTMVAGLDLGGQKADEASQILTDQAHWLSITKINLVLNNSKQSMNAIDLGISVDPDTASHALITPDDSLGWLKVSFWREFFRGKTIPLTF